jgi:hypothetical protein
MHVIIAAEMCPSMSTYIQTHWVTHLRVLRLLNKNLILDQIERETPKVDWGGLKIVPIYHGWIWKGLKP